MRRHDGADHPLSCRCQLCLTVRAIARDQSERLNYRRGFDAAMRQVHGELRTYAQSDHDPASCDCDLCQTVRALVCPHGLTLDQRESVGAEDGVAGVRRSWWWMAELKRVGLQPECELPALRTGPPARVDGLTRPLGHDAADETALMVNARVGEVAGAASSVARTTQEPPASAVPAGD